MILIDTLDIVMGRKLKKVPDGAFEVSFKTRLRTWRDLVSKYRRGKNKERLLKIASRIANAQAQRNRITHGLWSWEYAAPERASASSFKPSFEFTEHFDFEKLMKVSDRIGEINFDLSYSKGKAQAWREMAQSGLGASRDFAMMMRGKDASELYIKAPEFVKVELSEKELERATLLAAQLRVPPATAAE